MSTKIINVLKEDSFDEILELFRQVEAEEVIFVLPKKGKFLSQEKQFALLAQTAESSQKIVSVLSTNNDVNDLAKKYEFNVLNNANERQSVKKDVVATAAVAVPPLDDQFRDDSFDAYDQNVIVPSDETMSVDQVEEKDDDKLEGFHETDDDDFTDSSNTDPKPSDDQNPTDEELVQEEKEIVEEDGEPKADLAMATSLDAILRAQKSRQVKIDDQGGHKIDVGIRNEDQKREKDITTVWNEEDPDEGRWEQLKSLHKRSWLPWRGSKHESKTTTRRWHVGWLYGLGILVMLGGIFWFLQSNQKAVITIKPAEQNLDIKLTIDVADTISTVDPVFNKLPGQLLSIQKSLTKEFTSTGEREVAQKARGKITVYNNFSSSPQPLIATTRFESSDGLIFRTLKTITVPGASTSGGKTNPGAIEVEVIAEKVGTTYNIPAGRFGIAAFKEKGDTGRYEKIYGESKLPMVGGASGLTKVATEADMDKAVTELKTQLRQSILEALNSQASGLKIAQEPEVSISPTQSTLQVDQAGSTFSVVASGSVKTVAFKESDLMQLIVGSVDKNQGFVVIPEKVSVVYQDAKFKETTGPLSMTIAVTGTAFSKVDTEKISKETRGKTEADLRGYFKDFPGIASTQITLSPFWLSRIPQNPARVRVILTY